MAKFKKRKQEEQSNFEELIACFKKRAMKIIESVECYANYQVDLYRQQFLKKERELKHTVEELEELEMNYNNTKGVFERNKASLSTIYNLIDRPRNMESMSSAGS